MKEIPARVDKHDMMYDHGIKLLIAGVIVDRQDMAETGMTSALPALIGRRVRHKGELYEIFEILEHDPPALVLRSEAHLSVQSDQHGEAHRRVPQTVTVPILLNPDRHPDLARMEIELLEPRPTVNAISA